MLHYGKLPATYDHRDLHYAALRSAAGPSLPKTPPIFGHGKDFVNWLMLGNGPGEPTDDYPSTWDAAVGGCGNCAWAGPAHETMELDRNAKRPVARFTGQIVVEQYSQYSGYNPTTGANDNGSSVRDVLTWRQTRGLWDADGKAHRIGPFVALEPKNLAHIIEAAYLFECVGIGFEVPESAQQQFGEGKPWSVVPGAEIVGGHYVPVVGRPAVGELAVVTWGRRQVLTEQFFSAYTDEAWAYITPERYSTVTGKSYEGYKDADLERYLSMVTG